MKLSDFHKITQKVELYEIVVIRHTYFMKLLTCFIWFGNELENLFQRADEPLGDFWGDSIICDNLTYVKAKLCSSSTLLSKYTYMFLKFATNVWPSRRRPFKASNRITPSKSGPRTWFSRLRVCHLMMMLYCMTLSLGNGINYSLWSNFIRRTRGHLFMQTKAR